MKIALLGNPNTGKSSIFNLLTGLKQQVGNFPGVTVEKKSGFFTDNNQKFDIVDFPGTYSLDPRSLDEKVVSRVIGDPENPDYPDLILAVVDASRLENNLFLFTQLYEFNIPMVLVLNMWDVAKKQGIQINLDKLKQLFPDITIVSANARLGLGKGRILNALNAVKTRDGNGFIGATPSSNEEINDKIKRQEAKVRKEKIEIVINQIQTKSNTPKQSRLDTFFVHPLWGYLFFLGVLLIMFQFIFSFAAYPMDFIDSSFGSFAYWMSNILPSGVLNDLVSEGIIPGVGGVVIFVPQIALLFFFIGILEETGYLSRVVFIMDRIMRPLGLNGKSVVPLMSSLACAIPGVMSARTISNWKERLITILIAPLMSCSARIPVYTLLIALVIPKGYLFGFINIQGIVLFGLYFLGIVGALVTALVLKLLIRSKSKGFMLLELPALKPPRWADVFTSVLEKVKIFIFDAGKIILAISIVLWFLASYGPGNSINNARENIRRTADYQTADKEEKMNLESSAGLKHSYIGQLGQIIEPAIAPLGYDWKIGISLITSFAAREVFVGSLSTIYAVQDEGNEPTKLIDSMRKEKRADGSPTYSLAAGISLMVFYVFAMQCMSTVAIVKRETQSWKWPLTQFTFMGIMAYTFSWLTYFILA